MSERNHQNPLSRGLLGMRGPIPPGRLGLLLAAAAAIPIVVKAARPIAKKVANGIVKFGEHMRDAFDDLDRKDEEAASKEPAIDDQMPTSHENAKGKVKADGDSSPNASANASAAAKRMKAAVSESVKSGKKAEDKPKAAPAAKKKAVKKPKPVEQEPSGPSDSLDDIETA